ncbi:hypothetical protein [Kitasatospora sp. NPDC093679]|uniref:hypothetical protein n=1 Tax=Kitasatospora sp. NPDC093679 TaxID=3154983 RepID=UPI00344A8A03
MIAHLSDLSDPIHRSTSRGATSPGASAGSAAVTDLGFLLLRHALPSACPSRPAARPPFEAPGAYGTFQRKDDGAVKILFRS